jgi:lipid A ethanolaminephosphotransferase
MTTHRSWMPLFRRTVSISHPWFCIGYCGAVFFATNSPTIGRLAKWFREGDALDLSAFIAYLLTGLCLFIAVFTLLAHRATIRICAILLVIPSAAAAYFISKYGVAIDSSMILNVVHTDTREVGQLLSSQMIAYVVLLMVVPILAILSVEIRFKPKGRYLLDSLKLFGAALFLAVVSLSLEYRAIFRAGNTSNKYIVYSLVPINVISASINATARVLGPYVRKDQRDLDIVANVTTPGNLVVVLAVGESSRRANFSLYGYRRQETNPVLRTFEGLHLLNGVATRGSTLYALPKILERDGVKLTTIVSKAGIPTACYVHYTLYDNCAAVGETMPSNCGHGGKCFDEDVIPLLRDNLRSYSSGYRFVVLHLGGGSHGPLYGDRHPPEFRRFTPTCNDADVANRCTLDELYNSYDNTILYVDHVLGETIRLLDGSGVPYVFIYLSDHGESLMEEGRLFHGVPPGMPLPPEQAAIPLIVKASIPVTIAQAPHHRQSQVFDSVLDLFSIESPGFDLAGSFIEKAPALRDPRPAASPWHEKMRNRDGFPLRVASNGASQCEAGELGRDRLGAKCRMNSTWSHGCGGATNGPFISSSMHTHRGSALSWHVAARSRPLRSRTSCR